MKKLIAVFTAMTLISVGAPPISSAGVTAPSVVILSPDSGKVLYSRGRDRKQPPASTAKLLTALVVLDRLPLSTWVTAPALVRDIEPSKLYLKPGDKLRVKDLLKALLLDSANDVASTLAVAVAGTEAKFGNLMTEKARSLGAKNSRFKSASGLPAEGQYATAYDMALVMREVVRHNTLMSILNQPAAETIF